MADFATIEEVLEASWPVWRRWLQANLWQLRHDHDDIIQDASAALITAVERRPADDIPNLAGLGFAIMKNRAIDKFRSQALRVARAAELKDSQPDSSPEVPEAIHYRQQLNRTLGFIAKLPAPDRELLIRGIAAMDTGKSALSTAERKKLQRLRMDLRQELKKTRSFHSR